MVKHFPRIAFVRYADDGLLHCSSRTEAVQLQNAVDERLKACGLSLHPDKTKIVYCRDANRKEKHPFTQFDFLGYSFRGRLAKSHSGKYFNSFSPAISRDSKKHIHNKMRQWRLGRWTDAELEDIARKVNSSLRGWWNYFGRFYPSSFKRVIAHLNTILVKWAVSKYKRFKGSVRKAKSWLRGVSDRDNLLLYHWKLGVLPSVEQ